MLVGDAQGVECRFYFDPAEGDLLALEMYPERERRSLRGLFLRLSPTWTAGCLPGRMEVRVGDESFGVFALEQFTFEKGGEEIE